MSEADEIYCVPWDGRDWDDVLEKQEDIVIAGGGDDWIFHRPNRLILDAQAAQDDRVRGILGEDCVEDDSDEELRQVASELGLVLLSAPANRLLSIVQEVRSIVPGGASLDHVLVAGPARWHGDDVPVPVDDPGTIPGRDTAAGSGITVVVLDTGIVRDPPFPVRSDPDDAEIPDEDGDNRRDPPAGHGTHLAGLVAATAAGATLVAERVLTTVAGQASELEVAKALRAIDEDVDLVNCSFSGPVLDDVAPRVIEEALARLPERTLVVACAGNTGQDRPQWPAASDRVIAVGAVGRRPGSQTWLRTDFSCHGSWVDCCAPGVAVQSSFLKGVDGFRGWARWSGTSMSTPQVVGAIAAIAGRPGMDVAGAVDMLINDTSRPQINGVGTLVDPADLP